MYLKSVSKEEVEIQLKNVRTEMQRNKEERKSDGIFLPIYDALVFDLNRE